MASIEELPDELLLYVFLYLDRADVFNIRLVCTQWMRLSFSSDLWRRLTMIDLDTHIEKLAWSAQNIKIVKQFVRYLYISMSIKRGKQFLRKLLSSNLTELRHLRIWESFRGNSETKDILAYLAQHNSQLSSLELKFSTCKHLNEYGNILASLPLRKLEINHGGSFGYRHTCNYCSEERWLEGLSNLYTVEFSALRELTLSVNVVGNAVVRQILNYCGHLESLALDTTDTESDCFNDLTRNNNLRKLRLCFVRLTDATLVDISQYSPFLQSCVLEGRLGLLTDSGMQYLLIKCRSLQRIALNNKFKPEPHISNATLYSIASNCSSLKYLHFDSINEITDVGFQALIENCENLVEIAMLDCDKLTDISMMVLSDNCPMLRKVEFSGSITGYKNITNIGVQYLIKRLSFLEEATFACLSNLKNIKLSPTFQMDLNETSDKLSVDELHIKDDNLKLSDCEDSNETISSNLTVKMENKTTKYRDKLRLGHFGNSYIKKLSFARCETLDDESLLQVLNYCPDLKELDLSHCSSLSNTVISRIIYDYSTMKIKQSTVL